VNVRYSRRATNDLDAIADYLTERSSKGAGSVERRIKQTIELISAFPRGGRSLEQRPEVRVLPVAHYPYLVFYTLAESEVLILHIRHASRAPVDPSVL
jgi:plasmid stabilization system protein ParE